MLGEASMRLLRHRLSWLPAVWLVFQIAVIAAPLVAATGSAIEEACTCPGGVHATTCPMHHGGPAKAGGTTDSASKQSAARCAMHNAEPPSELALLALAGGAGVLPQLVTCEVARQSNPYILLQSH